MAEFNSMHSAVSHKIVNLTVQLWVQATFVEGLKTASRGRATPVAGEEDRWKVREQELMNRLDTKAVVFFHMGFEVAVRQLAARGYPPPGADSKFLDWKKAFLDCLLEVFEL